MQTFPTSVAGRSWSTPQVRAIALHVVLALLIAGGGYSVARRVVSDPFAGPVVVVAAPPGVVAGAPSAAGPDVDGVLAPGPDGSPPALDSGQFLPTWPPCAAVTVRLDSSVPASAVDAVMTEARTVLLLSGHPVVEAGTVDFGPLGDPGLVSAVAEGELVIGLTPEGRLGGDVVGTAFTTSKGGHTRSGLVVVDVSIFSTDHFLPVLRHELGHVVGLPHAEDPSELMYPTRLPGAPSSFQARELDALRAIAHQPCETAP